MVHSTLGRLGANLRQQPPQVRTDVYFPIFFTSLFHEARGWMSVSNLRLLLEFDLFQVEFDPATQRFVGIIMRKPGADCFLCQKEFGILDALSKANCQRCGHVVCKKCLIEKVSFFAQFLSSKIYFHARHHDALFCSVPVDGPCSVQR
jgi:hypothetical protein